MIAAASARPVPTLDHVGFVGTDLARLEASMRSLGFTTTAPRDLMRLDAATGALVPLQQQSCHAVFAAGYLELSAVLTDDPAHHLAAYRARGDGLHILALGSPDPDADWQRCRSAGLDCSTPAAASRRIDYGTRHGEARFRWFMLQPQASPEGLLCLVRNETPDLVFQPEVTRHDNGALALCEVIVGASAPAEVAARYAIVTGVEPQPMAGAATGGLRHVLAGGGALSLLPPAAMQARFGADAVAGLPAGRFAALQLRVARLDDTADFLVRRGVPFARRGPELVVPAAASCGAILAFRE